MDKDKVRVKPSKVLNHLNYIQSITKGYTAEAHKRVRT